MSSEEAPKSKKVSASAVPLTMEAMVKQILEHQERLHVELKSFKPTLADDVMDDYTLTLLTPTGKNEQLTEAVVEVKTTITTSGEGWRKSISKIARTTLIINAVSVKSLFDCCQSNTIHNVMFSLSRL